MVYESNERLEHVRNAITARSDLIRNLRKKLQFSNDILFKRENKLEEKIHQGKDLKQEVEAAVLERDRLKDLLQQSEADLEQQRSIVAVKDKEIKDLLNKMSVMERDLNKMYHRMSERERELSDTRNQLLNYSSCPDCSWMREYIQRLEYQLENFHQPHGRNSSRLTMNAVYPAEEWRNNGQWPNSYHRDSANLSSSQRQFPAAHNQPPIHRAWMKHGDAQRRQQAVHRQRVQEFRAASHALSPIREDAEEMYGDGSGGGSDTGSRSCKGVEKQTVMGVRQNTTDITIIDVENKTKFTDETGDQSCHYFTVHSPAVSPSATNIEESKKNDVTSMDYLHIASENTSMDDVIDHGRSSQQPTREKKFGNQNNFSEKKPASRLPSRSVASPSRGGSLSLHRLALSNTAPDLSSKKQFFPVRSFPLLNSSLTPTGSLASTDSPTSDTTGCSSDSGVPHQEAGKKRVRRSKRAKTCLPMILYRGHSIDVTKFSSTDFREIMWSLCAEPKAADEFLNFLASYAKRLNSDPQWCEKHNLGNADDWLALKGTY